MSWRWLLWLIPVYLVGLVVFAPARLLLWFIPAHTGIELSAVQGSLWQGQANLSYALASQQQRLVFNDISWQLDPWRLLTGTAAVDVQLPSANVVAGDAHVALGLAGDIKLSGEFGGNLQQAVVAYQLPVPITLDGQWSLQLENFRLDDLSSGQWCSQLVGNMNTRGTAVRLNQQWTDLGPFATTLSCSSKNEIIATMAGNNSVGLSFDTRLAGSQQAPQVFISGKLQPSIQTPRAVTDVLVFLGTPDANGAYPFSFSL
ncbi:type II secretion system protein N [Pseudidiomarina sp. E22-M8]|uniref:type II secretion system protein N n=1 Tax=Pseudidiomarina sp. E22-M8 TaxID=3424768 RepID=UPI00403C0674